MTELRRKGYADIFYLIFLSTVAGISVFMFIVGYVAYNLLGGIMNFTIIMLFIFGGIMAGFTFLVWMLGRSRGLGLPGGKCEICGVEFSAHRCTACGRSFGPNCLPKDTSTSSRCFECDVCAICGINEVNSACVNCGKPMCSTCYSKARHTCIECAGDLVKMGKIKVKSPPRNVKAKTVILAPENAMSHEICQKISSKVSLELKDKTIKVEDNITALNTTFEVIATNPLTEVTVVPTTVISVVNPKSRDLLLKNRQSKTIPTCYGCDSLAIKICRTCDHTMCVRHQRICPECGKVYCLDCYNVEKDQCRQCLGELPPKATVMA